MMKVFVTGTGGQLGHDVMDILSERGIPCVGADLPEFDLTHADAVKKQVLACAPDAIIHCAAYTAVDKAEECPEDAYAVNAAGTRAIAEAAKLLDAKMIYVSTDYVFDGQGETPFQVDDRKGPQNQYGLTKLQGEEAVIELLDKYFIVRTSWVFGGKNGKNFVRTMLHLAETRDTLDVVCDQVGTPTYSYDLAVLLCDMVVTDRYGVYHGTNENFCSWYEFACEIFRQAGKQMTIHPVLTSNYTAAVAKRPLNSRLSKQCLDEAGFHRLPTWQDALHRYLKLLAE